MDQEKERLVLENLDIVLRLMRLLACVRWRKDQDWEDAYQAGCLGLVQAAWRYDPAKRGFRTYASSRVRGALLDWARSNHPMYKAFRPDKHGPRPVEVVSLEQRIARMKSYNDDELSIGGALATTQDVERDAVVRDAVNSLPERQRFILEGRMSGYCDREIAEALGLSESRICQLRAKIRATLREALA